MTRVRLWVRVVVVSGDDVPLPTAANNMFASITELTAIFKIVIYLFI